MLQAITRLNNLWREEYKQMAAALETINRAQKALKVTVAFKEDKAAFQSKIEEVCRGSGIRKEAYEAIARTYADFAEIYKDLEGASKLTKGKAEDFAEIITQRLPQLLTFQVPNSFDVTYHGRPLKSHSLGQRASAMMLFLLSQGKRCREATFKVELKTASLIS